MKHLWIVAAWGMAWGTVAFAQAPVGPVGASSQPATQATTTQPATTQAAIPAPKQAMMDEAELRKVLGLVVNDVQMMHLPLLEALDRVRELSGRNIYVDVKALRGEGVTNSLKITYKADKATVAEVLTAILKQALDDSRSPLGFDVMGKSIVVSTKGRLRDLVLQYHTDIYKLGEPAVAKVLNTPIEEIKIERVPFRQAIVQLGKAAGQTIKLDKDSVIAAGVSLETPISFQGKDLTLGQALRLALHDAEGSSPLDYIVEDGKVTVFGPAPQ